MVIKGREALKKQKIPKIKITRPPAAKESYTLKTIPKPVVKKEARAATAKAIKLFESATGFYKKIFNRTDKGKAFYDDMAKSTELGNLLFSGKIPMYKLFSNCKVQTAYDNKQKIYTVMTMLDNRPRILTLRVGDNFTELSVAKKTGDVLEVLRQEGNNVSLMKGK